MSETPETDAETMQDEWDHVDTDFGPFEPSTTVPADFARELERERVEERKEWYSLQDAFEDSCNKIEKLELALSEILKVNENTPVLIYQKMEDIANAALE